MPNNISPEPWTLQTLCEGFHGYPDWTTYAIRSRSNICLAVVGAVDRASAPENKANAQLMLAAPELLAALETMQGWLNHPEIRFKMCNGGDGNLGEQAAYHSMMRAARAAISKAKGEA